MRFLAAAILALALVGTAAFAKSRSATMKGCGVSVEGSTSKVCTFRWGEKTFFPDGKTSSIETRVTVPCGVKAPVCSGEEWCACENQPLTVHNDAGCSAVAVPGEADAGCAFSMSDGGTERIRCRASAVVCSEHVFCNCAQ